MVFWSNVDMFSQGFFLYMKLKSGIRKITPRNNGWIMHLQGFVIPSRGSSQRPLYVNMTSASVTFLFAGLTEKSQRGLT